MGQGGRSAVLDVDVDVECGMWNVECGGYCAVIIIFV